MTEKIEWDSLTFSLTPTDTMYLTETTATEPWMPGSLRPYGPISMSPAAGVINYGQGLFEGMKAFRTSSGRVVFFRPEENARRMQRGADRLKMPPVPESIFIDAVEQCVQANIQWVPPTGKGAMYVRPLLMGSGPILGVAPAPSYTFLVYVTPVGPYFKGGVSAIDLLISEEYHRAAPGGSGGVKAIGNYAPGMMPSKKAKAAGYAEVIYRMQKHIVSSKKWVLQTSFVSKKTFSTRQNLLEQFCLVLHANQSSSLRDTMGLRLSKQKCLQNLRWMQMKHFVAVLQLLSHRLAQSLKATKKRLTVTGRLVL